MMTQGLSERIHQVSVVDPQAGAIEYRREWYSWGEIASCMASVESRLTTAGIGRDQLVGVLLRNRPGLFAAAMQVLASYRCLAPINPFQGAEKVAADIRELKLPVVIADPDEWNVDQIRSAVQDTGALGISIASTAGAIQCQTVQEVTPTEWHAPLPGTCFLMLTSGTTGPAKRIELPYRNFERALIDAAVYEQKGSDQLVLKSSAAIVNGPLVHIGGMYMAVYNVVSARPFVLLEKFSVEEWHRAVVEHRPRVGSLPPTAIRMVLDAKLPPADLSSLLAVRTGTAPLDPDLADAFESFYAVPILDVYGATEFAGAVAGWTLEDHRKFKLSKRGAVGRAQPGTALRVIDPTTGAELPPGATGILEVKSAQVDATAWLRTTDLAEIDEDGFLYIRGRADDAIIRGGFKILPGDVERAIRQHEAVKDVCVVGVPDERLGVVPVAAVELHDGHATVTGDEVLAEARKHLVSYQVPVDLRIVELPRTPALKISKYEVRRLFQDVMAE